MADEIVSEASLARFKPNDKKEYEVKVRDVPPLKLLVRPSGVRTWIVRKAFKGGKQIKYTIGDETAVTLDVAMEEARAALALIKKGINPNEAKKAKAVGPVTLGDVAEQWLRLRQSQRRNGAQVERIVRHDLLPFVGDKPIAELEREDITKCVRKAQERGALGIARHTWRAATAMLNWATESAIIKGSPLAGARLSSLVDPPSPRTRWLTPEELRDVWAAAEGLGEPHASVIKLLILTGARLNEIARLEWVELDRANSAIHLPGHRTKRTKVRDQNVGRTILLSPQALAIVQQVKPPLGADGRVQSKFVFAKESSEPVGNWDYPMKKLTALLNERRAESGRPEIEHWTPHDLRRSASTLMGKKLRVPVEVREAILGHIKPGGSVSSMVPNYNVHDLSDDDDLKEARLAINAWGEFVAEHVMPPEPSAPALAAPVAAQPVIVRKRLSLEAAAALASDQQQAEPVDPRIPLSYRNLKSKVVMREDGDGAGFVIGGSRPMTKG